MIEGQAPRDTVVPPGDKRYPALSRGFNQRWIAEPEYVRLVRSPEEVRVALADALRERPRDPRRTRITVRSGGHCYEDFVCGDDVRVILDVSPMCAIAHDPVMDAYMVEAGATNWHVYSHLYPLSGTALPGGSCYSVGLGGHITGGGFGLLSRQHGLTVDYLYAVEVAVAGPDRSVQLVTATRDDDGDLGELFWAHTGGGGGNFGIVTRFWFRDLPEPPERVLLTGLAWNWADFTAEDFTALLTAYGEYFRDHQDPRDASGRLFALLKLNHVSNGQIGLIAQVDLDDGTGADAMAGFLEAVDGRIRPPAGAMFAPMGEHAPVAHAALPRVLPWLTATQALNASGENRCGKYKSAYFREPFDSGHIAAMWDYLGNDKFRDYRNPQALIQVDSYGSAINTPRHDTAVRQRDSILKLQYQVYWTRGDVDEPDHVDWIRQTYRATFADTGGVPVVGDATDGCYISYPDADLSDPQWNASEQPWSTLYYKDAYRRLQRVKEQWDPLDVFRHRQSVRPRH
ncbi:putative FAD-linked oxidoreductase YvdP [Actinomadura rubteroloni]|uniref:Putative FAD-linked oxidoreductase YvdP n=1 Tax=Actinomadura rubteroloni TaxID=1926885 RepID=A0A2P4UD49_9ACTN|nr:BBE domain-containing protein [Actinomadura rubteroloni]POM22967.1 putative FAD-linked oxidoreductase YvdP [Actinomadura rubteroloni]